MKKTQIYLTDITLHTRGFRPTVHFSKVAEKGRMYFPLSTFLGMKKANNPTDKGTSMFFPLPKDLLGPIKRGEVELMMPQNEPLITVGQDVIEAIAKKKEMERLQIIHNNRNNTWHEGDLEVR